MIGFLRVLAWLPLPLLYLLGAIGGEIAYLFHFPRRKITLRNLTACFPHMRRREIRRLARGHFRSLVIAVLATSVAWWGGINRLRRLIRLRDGEILQSAQSRGENIILLTPHIAGLEFGGIYLSALAPIINIYQRHKNPLLDKILHTQRARFHGLQYPRKTSVTTILRLLRRGHCFYYLADQDPNRGGKHQSIFAPFYSIPTATYATLGRFAELGNAIVIPCTTRLLSWGRGFEIIFEPPLVDFPSGNKLTDTTRMNQSIEQLIQHAPEQYFWSHRRFKTRPAGEPAFYL